MACRHPLWTGRASSFWRGATELGCWHGMERMTYCGTGATLACHGMGGTAWGGRYGLGHPSTCLLLFGSGRRVGPSDLLFAFALGGQMTRGVLVSAAGPVCVCVFAFACLFLRLRAMCDVRGAQRYGCVPSVGASASALDGRGRGRGCGFGTGTDTGSASAAAHAPEWGCTHARAWAPGSSFRRRGSTCLARRGRTVALRGARGVRDASASVRSCSVGRRMDG